MTRFTSSVTPQLAAATTAFAAVRDFLARSLAAADASLACFAAVDAATEAGAAGLLTIASVAAAAASRLDARLGLLVSVTAVVCSPFVPILCSTTATFILPW